MSVFTRIAAIALIAAATPAFAYIGPGSGISLLGGIWSVLVGILLALAAILFWPIRLMIKRMRRRRNERQVEETPAASGESD